MYNLHIFSLKTNTDIILTTMIFVPSKNGHSHCEKEFTPLENCIKGANVLLQTILDIDKN